MQTGACLRAAFAPQNRSHLFACFMKRKCFWLRALVPGSAVVLKGKELLLVSSKRSSAISYSEEFFKTRLMGHPGVPPAVL